LILTFTIDDKAHDAADAADRSGRDRRLDRPRSGGARQAHRRTRSDRHCAAGLDADLLSRRGAAADHGRQHRSQRRRFQRRGRIRADRLAGRIFVGLGSDHTDRKVEAYSVTVSKQMCDKPMAPVLWELEDVAGHWDRMILRAFAWIDGARVLYQEGTLDAMLPVKELIERGFGGAGCRTAAPCSAAPLRPRAASAPPAGSNSSSRTPC
jgi:hypothetical protein